MVNPTNDLQVDPMSITKKAGRPKKSSLVQQKSGRDGQSDDWVEEPSQQEDHARGPPKKRMRFDDSCLEAGLPMQLVV